MKKAAKKDPVPKGKKQKYGESLREKEDIAQAEIINAIDSKGGNMSVIQLLERFIPIYAVTRIISPGSGQ